MTSETFTKLFSSIIHSSVWQQGDHVRLTWITMLAMVNKDGIVFASVPGLAAAARVTLEQCKQALVTLSSPDEHSRNKAHDGRRIREVQGGWALLNHQSYRERVSAEDARQSNADRQRRFRENHPREERVTLPVTNVTPSDQIRSDQILGDPPKPPARKKGRARRTPGRRGEETLLPEDFAPTDEHLARAQRDSLDCAHELEKFKNNALSKGLVYVNWNAAFTTWLMNAPGFKQRNGHSHAEAPKDNSKWFDDKDFP